MLGCLFAPFVWVYRFIRWCFENGIKGYIILGIVVLLVLIGSCMIRGEVQKQKAIELEREQQKELYLPARSVAPYIVKTSSRTYYAVKAVKDKEGNIVMTDWWELLGREWTKNTGTLVLDVENYGKNISIGKRR